jgi:hypothetical protein
MGKRKSTEDPVEDPPHPSLFNPATRPFVQAPPRPSSHRTVPIRNIPLRNAPLIPPPSQPSSPAFSLSNLSSLPSEFVRPPSTIGTSRSAPEVSQSSLQFENRILRSQLDCVTADLKREKERSQEEIGTIRAQFAAEKRAYLEYIESLGGGMRM